MTAWSLARYGGGRYVHARIHADGEFVGHVTVAREAYNDLAERLTRPWQDDIALLRAALAEAYREPASPFSSQHGDLAWQTVGEPSHPDGPAVPDLAPEAGERTDDAAGGEG